MALDQLLYFPRGDSDTPYFPRGKRRLLYFPEAEADALISQRQKHFPLFPRGRSISPYFPEAIDNPLNSPEASPLVSQRQNTSPSFPRGRSISPYFPEAIRSTSALPPAQRSTSYCPPPRPRYHVTGVQGRRPLFAASGAESPCTLTCGPCRLRACVVLRPSFRLVLLSAWMVRPVVRSSVIRSSPLPPHSSVLSRRVLPPLSIVVRSSTPALP